VAKGPLVRRGHHQRGGRGPIGRDRGDGRQRRRFVERRLDSLRDEPWPGAPRGVTDDDVEAVVVKTGGDTDRCHALVDSLDGQGDGHESFEYGSLACLARAANLK
jgi:hypothetical protein